MRSLVCLPFCLVMFLFCLIAGESQFNLCYSFLIPGKCCQFECLNKSKLHLLKSLFMKFSNSLMFQLMFLSCRDKSTTFNLLFADEQKKNTHKQGVELYSPESRSLPYQRNCVSPQTLILNDL